MRPTRVVLVAAIALVAAVTSPGAPAMGEAAAGVAVARTRVVPIRLPSTAGFLVDQLSEGGHVTLLQPSAPDRIAAYRWHRGELLELVAGPDRTVWPADVNARGEVVGTTTLGLGGGWPTARGFAWSDGIMTPVPARTGGSEAVAIDRRGRVLLNRSLESAQPWRASVLDGDREITSPLLAGGATLVGRDVEGRLVAGYSPDTELAEAREAVLWRAGEAPVRLGTLGAPWSQSIQINRAGSVMGESATAEGDHRMFLWRRGAMTDLGTLGGRNTVLPRSGGRPDLLSDHDLVVGASETSTGETHAFLWSDGRMRDLGTLGGGYSTAYGVNDHAEVVGVSTIPSGESHGFLWRNGRMENLGALADASSSSATAINDRGQIVGAVVAGGAAGPVLWETRRR
jgi:probable HAF family extracellular repeat protein